MSYVIETKTAPKFPLPFSQGIRAGDFLFLAGQVGVDPETLLPVGETIQEQTQQCISNIESILQEAGLSLDHVVKATTHLRYMEDMPAYNSVYQEVFKPPYPARTTVVSGLDPYLIEIEVIAYVPSVRGEKS